MSPSGGAGSRPFAGSHPGRSKRAGSRVVRAQPRPYPHPLTSLVRDFARRPSISGRSIFRNCSLGLLTCRCSSGATGRCTWILNIEGLCRKSFQNCVTSGDQRSPWRNA